ncbi:hypothetical protein TYRP_013817 [Tyrophagus putrescentiae]|nr:hypothetical protein TYRP_013817 [Tyrophagus putrescentiae]
MCGLMMASVSCSAGSPPVPDDGALMERASGRVATRARRPPPNDQQLLSISELFLFNEWASQQQQESSAFTTTTTTSSTSTLLESLGQVDLSALKRQPAASYDRLLETARMISALDVGKDLATVKDRDQHEATLRKLLQVSQTIIECLLVKGGASESKNDINAYQNNLRQENAKLRKLLSLQQKAIAFRRANLWTASDNSSRGCEDEDVSTSAAVDVSLLPEDSTVINRLQMEIGQLKEKLAATEQALDEEKSARAPESSASSEVHQHHQRQQIEPAQETATFEDSRAATKSSPRRRSAPLLRVDFESIFSSELVLMKM